MIKIIYLMIFLLGYQDNEAYNVKDYDGYFIALVSKDAYDSHFDNEYFFLPKDYKLTHKKVNTDTLENHLPKIEKIIKKHSGFLVSNSSHLEANDASFIKMMYFYLDSSSNKIDVNLFLKRYNRQYSIYVIKAKFKAEYSLDHINKTYRKLYIKDLEMLTKLTRNDIKKLKKLL